MKRQNPLILIVDDEPKLVRLVCEILKATGYEGIAASSGEQALRVAAMEQPDLIVLDIMLAGNMNGYEVARRFREFTNVPIIMLTAKVQEADLLLGFEVGADDYITKPFSAKEMLARLRAVLKRARETNVPLSETEIICGDLCIHLLRRTVEVAGQEIHLTPTEYNLLCELAQHPNQVLFHEHLLESVWGPEYRNDVEYLRSYIHILRKKIEADPANPKIILNSPGVGYMLAVPELERASPVKQ
jgi:DNA-binding response OmpR family regulator